jgi:Flp pilus assembly protein TadG
MSGEDLERETFKMTRNATARRHTAKRRSDGRGGAAATELALVLPFLVTVVLGCVDFGRISYAYLTVSNAARVGAEYGATHKFTAYSQPFWDSQVRQQVINEMGSVAGFDQTQLQTTINTAADSYGLVRITVDVEYPFQAIVSWPFLPHQVQLWRRTSMREIR